MTIGDHIRESRKAMGLTQKQLAEKAGVGLNFVYQLEKNKPSVQLDCTLQVLHALGLTLSVEAARGHSWSGPVPAPAATPRPSLPWD